MAFLEDFAGEVANIEGVSFSEQMHGLVLPAILWNREIMGVYAAFNQCL